MLGHSRTRLISPAVRAHLARPGTAVPVGAIEPGVALRRGARYPLLQRVVPDQPRQRRAHQALGKQTPEQMGTPPAGDRGGSTPPRRSYGRARPRRHHVP